MLRLPSIPKKQMPMPSRKRYVVPASASPAPSAKVTPHPFRSAFTLVELLVALVILGILGSAMAGVLRNTTDSLEQGSDALNHLTRIRSLETVLGGALRDALPIELSQDEKRLLEEDGSYDSADGDYRFRGEPTALGFCLNRPFLQSERDGYMHWILLEVREGEDGNQSLWLTDTSYLNGVDNPVGEDWGSDLFSGDSELPVKELQLLPEANSLSFAYWQLDEESTVTDEPEPLELEEEDIEGHYALELPDYIVFEIDLPKFDPETLIFDFSLIRREAE